MVIDFSKIGVVKEQPVLILRNADGTAIQTLGNAFHLKADICYNEMSTITFDLPAYANGMPTPHYDEVTGMRVVDMLGWGQFILVDPATKNDGVKEIKSCKAYSLEYELTYKQAFFEEGTYNFWNPVTPENTVLGLILSDLPSWTVGHVDDALIGKYRTFSESNANIYNFMKSTLQKTYSCIFDFDTYHRTINVRSVSSGAQNTPVHISLNNLAKNIDINEDSESIVTALEVYGADGVDIRMVNPLGTNTIYNLDYFMNDTHFSQDMLDKWQSWKNAYEAKQKAFYNLSVERAVKTAAILTEETKLSEMERTELATLENERAVYVQYLATLTDRTSETYRTYQAKLDTVNAQITAKNAEIQRQKDLIETLQEDKDALTEGLRDIQSEVSFENFFTPAELLILQRYFKEDRIEDSTFVLSEVDSYTESDISTDVSNVGFTFTGGTVTRIQGREGTSLYMVSGGRMVCARQGEDAHTVLQADVIKATFERNTGSGSFVLAAYLGTGIVGEAELPGGCISVTGTCGAESSNVTYDGVQDAYREGTSLSVTATDGRLYLTRNTTEFEQYSVAWDLFEYGAECLKQLAYPSYSFNISSGNFFADDAFRSFVLHMALGSRVYLDIDGKILEPICIGVSLDFDNLASLSLKFGDKFSASDREFKLVELLDQSISMGKTLDANKLSYSSFVDSGASNRVRDFMNSALDVAKNMVLSSSGQGVAWDSSGLHLRKYLQDDDPDAGFDPKQIWAINNCIAFTDDGWQTAKMAIGEVFDENLVSYHESSDNTYDGSKTYYYLDESGAYQIWDGGAAGWGERPTLYERQQGGSAYGIVAPYIVGTMIAGQNLIIGTKDGSFRVDESGVHIDALKFYITHDGNIYQTLDQEFEDVDQKIEDASSALSEEIDAAKDRAAQDLADAIGELNGRIDGTVTTYYQAEAPVSANNGDLWFDTDDGKLYRYLASGYTESEDTAFDAEKVYYYLDGEGVYQIWDGGASGWDSRPTLYEQTEAEWQPMEDSGIEDALSAAQYAAGIAEGKITTFYQSEPPESANDGDLWFDTDDSRLYRYDSGAYTETEDDTFDSSKTYYIPDGEGGYQVWDGGAEGWDSRPTLYEHSPWQPLVSDDGAKTWYQDTVPEEPADGDLWFNTSDTAVTSGGHEYAPRTLYYYSDANGWQIVQDGKIDEVDEKVDAVGAKVDYVLDDDGNLDADKLRGLLGAHANEMATGGGNVLFDSDGIWLMDKPDKSLAKKAVWMNDKGIQFANRNNPSDSWSWGTAIDSNGITANAIKAGTLTGIAINNGNGTFSVDASGNLTCTNASVTGNISASTLKLGGEDIRAKLSQIVSQFNSIGSGGGYSLGGSYLSGYASDLSIGKSTGNSVTIDDTSLTLKYNGVTKVSITCNDSPVITLGADNAGTVSKYHTTSDGHTLKIACGSGFVAVHGDGSVSFSQTPSSTQTAIAVFG